MAWSLHPVGFVIVIVAVTDAVAVSDLNSVAVFVAVTVVRAGVTDTQEQAAETSEAANAMSCSGKARPRLPRSDASTLRALTGSSGATVIVVDATVVVYVEAVTVVVAIYLVAVDATTVDVCILR